MLLQASPHNRASELALKIYETVLERVRADRLVHQAVQRVGDELFVQSRHLSLAAFERVFIYGAGKASVTMARALAEILGDRCSGGLVVTKEHHAEAVSGVEVIEAGHPVPSEASLTAGARMLEEAAQRSETDLVFFLLSGGASALLEAPVEGLSLEDLAETNKVLLGSGLDIRAVNSVRSQLSRIKAGGLARAFSPATVIALVLSDVIGNDLRSIGSGPFMPAGEADVPEWIIDKLPVAVQEQLRYPPLLRDVPPVEHYVIGSVSLAVHEAAEAARSLGLAALPYGDPLQGEARVMARRIVREGALQMERQEGPFCMIFGGETTVTLHGDGLGGRCQEMAAAASWQLSRLSGACLLAAGTDGTDGPTLAAGGLADPETCARAGALREALRRNNAFHYLERAGGLIVTGPTGSNVNDLVLFVSV